MFQAAVTRSPAAHRIEPEVSPDASILMGEHNHLDAVVRHVLRRKVSSLPLMARSRTSVKWRDFFERATGVKDDRRSNECFYILRDLSDRLQGHSRGRDVNCKDLDAIHAPLRQPIQFYIWHRLT